MFPPTLMSWLPRTMSNESEMEKTLVPPWNGAYPRSPSDQYPLNSVDVNPQLMPPRLAPGMPSFCASHSFPTRRSSDLCQPSTNASQICARNAKFLRVAGAAAKRRDFVEDPIETNVDLIDGPLGENVRFRQRGVAPVIGDVLRAAKGAGFGEAWRTARNERGGLIVAEAREHRVLAGKIVVQPDVELAFVELPHRLV